MNEDSRTNLIQLSLEVREKAYAPYSNFKVGSALLTKSGEIFVGCNVENASYGLAICAERNAICQAVAKGFLEFEAIAIAATPLATPCGACRQFIAEFGGDIEVICVDSEQANSYRSWSIDQLLPERFSF